MKPAVEEIIEQIKGEKEPINSQSLKEQFDPKTTFKQFLSQLLGFGQEKKVPTTQELKKMSQQDREQKEQKIEETTKQLEQESKQKGNLELVKPAPRLQAQQAPAYITGKPGFNPEAEEKEEKEKKKLPPLPAISTKPKKGSWLSAMERKQKGAEVKGGRE